MSFKNYTRKDLAPSDANALAAALTTIYTEGMGSFPPNPRWDDQWWNTYSIGYIPGTLSFIVIDASEGEGDQPERFMVFSVNTNRQTVTWKAGDHASDITPVPEHLQPFFLQLTSTVHGIAAKRRKAEEERMALKRKAEEEAKIYYEANKDRIDAEREVKRRKMKEDQEKAAEERARRELKGKLECRKVELEEALRVMDWKASAAQLPTSPPDEKKPTEVHEMLQSAKRGSKHDLCEDCAATLRFCGHKGCTIIGCETCFEDVLTTCAYCSSVFCEEHTHDMNQCSTCGSLVCEPCDGQSCPHCDEYICLDCSRCGHCDISLNEDVYIDDYLDDYHDDYDNDYSDDF